MGNGMQQFESARIVKSTGAELLGQPHRPAIGGVKLVVEIGDGARALPRGRAPELHAEPARHGQFVPCWRKLEVRTFDALVRIATRSNPGRRWTNSMRRERAKHRQPSGRPAKRHYNPHTVVAIRAVPSPIRSDCTSAEPRAPVSTTPLETRQSEAKPSGNASSSGVNSGGDSAFVAGETRQRKQPPRRSAKSSPLAAKATRVSQALVATRARTAALQIPDAHPLRSRRRQPAAVRGKGGVSHRAVPSLPQTHDDRWRARTRAVARPVSVSQRVSPSVRAKPSDVTVQEDLKARFNVRASQQISSRSQPPLIR